MPMGTCLICGQPTETYRTGGATVTEFACADCGSYKASQTVIAIWRAARNANNGRLEPDDERLLPYLAAATRRAATPVTLLAESWRALAEAERARPLHQKLGAYLEWLSQNSTSPGEWVLAKPRSLRPLLALRDDTELDFIEDHLRELGLIQPGQVPDPDNAGHHLRAWRLTVKGWQQANPLGAGVLGTCFVAMSFHPSLNDAYDNGILPAVETDCGFRVLRVDRVEHNDPITDKIIAGIKSAQFVVADFTMQRQGVYYEAGFALGLGRDVVWTCREDEKDNLHFDTRQFNHVMWTTPAELRAKLADRIKATIPGAKPGI